MWGGSEHRNTAKKRKKIKEHGITAMKFDETNLVPRAFPTKHRHRSMCF